MRSLDLRNADEGNILKRRRAAKRPAERTGRTGEEGLTTAVLPLCGCILDYGFADKQI